MEAKFFGFFTYVCMWRYVYMYAYAPRTCAHVSIIFPLFISKNLAHRSHKVLFKAAFNIWLSCSLIIQVSCSLIVQDCLIYFDNYTPIQFNKPFIWTQKRKLQVQIIHSRQSIQDMSSWINQMLKNHKYELLKRAYCD